MRAVTVAVSDASGVGGFVFPGDRVDLVLTQEVTGDGRSLKASETIVRDVRVLAVDQSVEAKEAKVGRTVTLEATPKISEKIAVGATIGTLSLALRSLADTPEQLAALQSGAAKDIAHAPNDTDTSVTTGGEVSRFQRSTLPPQTGGGGGGGSPAPAAAAPKVVRAPTPAEPSVKIFRGGSATAPAAGTV
jgi:pilus assembly protein CpaB